MISPKQSKSKTQCKKCAQLFIACFQNTDKYNVGLATLLGRVNNIFKVHFKNISFFFLLVLFCVKVGNSDNYSTMGGPRFPLVFWN